MKAVFERELRSYYTGLTGYVIAAVLLAFIGIYTLTLNLTYGYPNFEYVLDSMTFIYMVLIPMLTMRLMAEEKKQRTDILLYSLPLSSGEVIVGKFLAAWVVLAVPLAVSGLYPVLLGMFGEVNYATAYASLFAFFLLGGALTAIGLFISCITENQVIAAVLCFLVLLVDFYASTLAAYVSAASYISFIILMLVGLAIALLVRFLTKNTVAALTFAVLVDGAMLVMYLIDPSLFGGVIADILQGICVFSRMTGFINGVFDFQAMVYYLSVIVLFLFLSVQSMEKGRWS